MSEHELESYVFWVAATAICWIVCWFLKKHPCIFGCKKKHLSIEKRIWTNGSCERNDHSYHGSQTVYITKWICTRPGCDEMGYYCAGETSKGSWTIQYGKVVPDEKEWMKWQ